MGETVTGNDTLVKYTYGGDANFDGTLNGDDYFRIDGHTPGALGWINGDFDYNGHADGDDYFLIDCNYIHQVTTPTPGDPVGSAGLKPAMA